MIVEQGKFFCFFFLVHPIYCLFFFLPPRCITGGHSNHDPPYTQKPIYYTFFANHIWSLLLCSPVIDYQVYACNRNSDSRSHNYSRPLLPPPPHYGALPCIFIARGGSEPFLPVRQSGSSQDTYVSCRSGQEYYPSLYPDASISRRLFSRPEWYEGNIGTRVPLGLSVGRELLTGNSGPSMLNLY